MFASRLGESRMLSPLSYLTPLKTVAALVGAGALMTGGVAVAVTGLPGAAQDTAGQRPENAQVSVPGPNEHSAGHADQRGSSAEHAADPSTGPKDGEHHGKGKGAAVSELAHDTYSTGAEKGAAVSGYASSSGRSHHADETDAAEAPEQPAAGGESDGSAQVDTPNSGGTDRPENASDGADDADGAEHSQAPVDTPNSGGTGTADAASDGASTDGTGTADGHSHAHSSAGSENGKRP